MRRIEATGRTRSVRVATGLEGVDLVELFDTVDAADAADAADPAPVRARCGAGAYASPTGSADTPVARRGSCLSSTVATARLSLPTAP